MTTKRYATPEQIAHHREYNREYGRRKRAGLPTRTTPQSVTAITVPTLGHEYHGVCTSCRMSEKLYKGMCAWCRSYTNIIVTNDARSTSGTIGAGRSPWAKAKH